MPQKPPYRRIKTKAGWAWIDRLGRRVSRERISQWQADKAFLGNPGKPPRRKADPSLIVQGKPVSAKVHLGKAKLRNAKGKFVKSSKAKKGKLPKLFRTSLGQTVPTRKGSKALREIAKIRDFILDSGKLPKPDATAIAPSDKGPVYVYYWRFEGLGSQPAVANLLRLLQTEVEERGIEISTRYSVGTGYGKGADWTGSHFNRPSETRTYFATWNTNSPSAQEIFRQAEAGGAIWFEVEAQTRQEITTHGKPRRKNRSAKGRGKTSVSGRGASKKGSSSTAKSGKQRKRTIQPVRGKQSSLGQDSRKRPSKSRRNKRKR